MADVKLSAILSPLPVQGVQANPVTGNATGTLASIFAQLGNGATISGFVLNRDASGNPILRTPDHGDLLIKTDLFLKIGSDVVVRVEQTNANQTSARIVTVDGLPPEQAQARSPLNVQDSYQPSSQQTSQGQSAQNSAQTSAASQAAQSTTAAPPKPPLLTATITNTPQTPPSLQASVQIASTSPALTKLLPTPLPSANTPATAANTAQPTPPTSSPANAAPTLPTGTQVQLRVLNVTLPEPGFNTQQPAAQTQATPTTAQQTSPVTTTSTAAPTTPAAPQNTAAPQQVQASAPVQTSQIPTAPTTSPSTPAVTNTVPAAQTVVTAASAATPQPPTATPSAPVAPPTLASVQAATPAQPVVVQAEVIASNNTHIFVRTPAGTLQVPGFTELPAGSKVTLEIATVSKPEVGKVSIPNLPPSTPATVGELARGWQTLQQIIATLQGVDGFTDEDMARLLGRLPVVLTPQGLALPTAAGQPAQPPLGSGLLFFLSALQGGSLRSWLGEKPLQVLDRIGQHHLLQKAEGELGVLRSLLTPVTSHSEQWQSYFIPVVAGEQVPMARLYVKKHRKNPTETTDSENESRFMVELELSQLGEVRMDGWLRKPSASTIFDLIIRTRETLPEQMQRDIIGIYDAAGALTGYVGKLVFQQVSTFPPSPMEALPDIHSPPNFTA